MKYHLHITCTEEQEKKLKDFLGELRTEKLKLNSGNPTHPDQIITMITTDSPIDLLEILSTKVGTSFPRVKIEKSILDVADEDTVLYYETHQKANVTNVLNPDLPISINAEKPGITVFTLRRNGLLSFMKCYVEHKLFASIEAVILDTNPELDEGWISW